MSFGQLAPSKWPGERLGLPAHGPTSVARAGRRIAALAIDWALAIGVGYGLYGADFVYYSGFATTLIFVIMQIVLIPIMGGSVGHRLLGLRLITLTGNHVGLWRPIVRTLLLAIVVPALVWDSDQRGFHDKVAGTVLIRA
ncbi:RDD family protein [Leifsonia sp. A12D58]|uniref:RDD family protein n=1 Tax=Leifsonia sp. A12D58 TaxID=3397674 RepID=UPI0039DF3C17